MLKEYLDEVQRPGQGVNPLFGFLGVKVEEISAERVVLRLPFRRDFLQGAGVIAGGVMAALADEAMAHVVLANLGEGTITATIEMNLRFLRSASNGDLTARATLVKKGRTIMTVAAEISDNTGQVLAAAGASFMVVEVK